MIYWICVEFWLCLKVLRFDIKRAIFKSWSSLLLVTMVCCYRNILLWKWCKKLVCSLADTNANFTVRLYANVMLNCLRHTLGKQFGLRYVDYCFSNTRNREGKEGARNQRNPKTVSTQHLLLLFKDWCFTRCVWSVDLDGRQVASSRFVRKL